MTHTCQMRANLLTYFPQEAAATALAQEVAKQQVKVFDIFYMYTTVFSSRLLPWAK